MKFSISDKLIIIFFSLNLFTIFVISTFTFKKSEKVLFNQTANHLLYINKTKTQIVKQFLSNQLVTNKLLASNQYIINLIEKQLIPNPRITPTLNPHLSQLLPSNCQILLFNSQNNSITFLNQTPFIATKSYKSILQTKLAKLHCKDISLIILSGKSFITFCSPVTIQHRSNYVLLTLLPLQQLNSLLNSINQSTNTDKIIHTFVINTSSATQFAYLQKLKHFPSTLTDTICLFNHDKTKIFCVLTKLNVFNLNLAIVSQLPYSKAMLSVDKIGYQIIFISLYITFLIFIVTILFAKSITKPIKQLNTAANKIKNYQFDVHIDYFQDDELGMLVDTFNQMALELKEKDQQLKKERLKSINSIIEGQEMERRRIAQDLHDSLGQLLVGLKMKFENLKYTQDQSQFNQLINDIQTCMNQTIAETRRITDNILPPGLSQFGLVSAVKQLISELNNTTNIKFFLFLPQNLHINDINKRTHIYRIIQEAVNNIIKHSKANNVLINIQKIDNTLIINISDDGIGFDINHISSSSHGINNINSRITVLNGQITWNSVINQGTQIIIKIPMP